MNILEGKSDSKELAEVLCSAAIESETPFNHIAKTSCNMVTSFSSGVRLSGY